MSVRAAARIALRLPACAVALLAIAPLAPAAHAGGRPAVLDSVSALTKARALAPCVTGAQPLPLWAEFSPEMRTLMGDTASFRRVLRNIAANDGPLDTVLSETLRSPRKGEFVYVASCRFARAPDPLAIVLAFDAQGELSGLDVRPAVAEAPPVPGALQGYRTRTTLHLPVRGEWTVAGSVQGAAEDPPVSARAECFGFDLVVVRAGRTHAGEGRTLADYYAYGQPVFAPAAGRVVWVQDSLPDNRPGSRDTLHALGNAVLIDHGNGEYSVLGHLQPRTLRVRVGQMVDDGAELGRCGSSGDAGEPRVHYHMQNAAGGAGAHGLPATFVDLIVNARPVARAELARGQQVAPAR